MGPCLPGPIKRETELCAFLVHGLDTKKVEGTRLPPCTTSYRQGFFYLSTKPGWEHCRKKAIYCWRKRIRVYSRALYAGHTDAWPGKQCTGSAQKKGALLSIASGHLMGYCSPWLVSASSGMATLVIPRQEVRGWSLGTNLSKMITVLGANCFHIWSYLILSTTRWSQ